MSQPVEGMSCETALDLIEAFLDDELGPTVAEEFHTHLEDCPTCSKEAADARQFLTELRSLPELKVPSRVIDNVRDAIGRHDFEAGTDPRSQIRNRWLAAAAAIIIGILGTTTMIRNHAEPTDAEALRAAAEVQVALATIGDITRRANQMVQAKVIDDRALPRSIRGLARSLGPLRSLESTDGTRAAPYEPTHEGSF